MSVAINAPKEKESALDKVMKGLQVAHSVFGIANDVTSIQARSQDMNTKQRVEDDTTQGVISKADLLKQGDNYDIAEAQSPGALKYQTRDKGELQDIYLTRKSAQPKSTALSQQDVLHAVNGGSVLTPPNTAGVRNYSIAKSDGSIEMAGIRPPKPKNEHDVSGLNPQAKLDKQPAEVRSKIGLVGNALAEMTDYEKAFESGERPTYLNSETPIIGSFTSDTNLTAASKRIDEAVGRLQSGGAIGKDELKTFRSMGPRAGDTPEIQRDKVGKQRAFLEDRLAAFGFSPEELTKIGGSNFTAQRIGIDSDSIQRRENISAGLTPPKDKSSGGMINEAKAGSGTGNFSQDDLSAMAAVKARLKANPKDPVALEARSILMQKGLK